MALELTWRRAALLMAAAVPVVIGEAAACSSARADTLVRRADAPVRRLDRARGLSGLRRRTSGCRQDRPPRRTAGNYRAYAAAHLTRLSFIRRSRDLGFSLDQIRALLDLADESDRTCAAVDAIAREHLAEVEREIADLDALRSELESMVRQCGHGAARDCRIIEALSPADALAAR